jgi:inhibitor of KinA sporulation pathway (predicted exonuclease)
MAKETSPKGGQQARRDVTNTEWYTHTAQMKRVETGLNRLLEHFGLQQTGTNTVAVDPTDNA